MRNTRVLTGLELNPKVGFPTGFVQTWVSIGSELLICLLFTGDISEMLGLNSLSFLLRCPCQIATTSTTEEGGQCVTFNPGIKMWKTTGRPTPIHDLTPKFLFIC